VSREEELSYALLWLRNHYELGDPSLKGPVLELVDKVLDSGPPLTGALAKQFRDKWAKP
jgi:hypothetical protein